MDPSPLFSRDAALDPQTTTGVFQDHGLPNIARRQALGHLDVPLTLGNLDVGPKRAYEADTPIIGDPFHQMRRIDEAERRNNCSTSS